MSTLRDIRLDPTTHDLDNSGGDLHGVYDLEAIAQDIDCALQFFQGEWYLDESAGLPIFQRILVKNPDPKLLSVVFQSAILARKGVKGLLSMTLDYDAPTRRISVDWRVDTDLGQLSGTTTVGP